MRLTSPTKMLTLFGSGAGMAWLLSASPAMAAETSSLFEAHPELLDFALGGMLVLSAIASTIGFARATTDIEVLHEPAFPAMEGPLQVLVLGLLTAAVIYWLTGVVGKFTVGAVLCNSGLLLIELWFATKHAIKE